MSLKHLLVIVLGAAILGLYGPSLREPLFAPEGPASYRWDSMGGFPFASRGTSFGDVPILGSGSGAPAGEPLSFAVNVGINTALLYGISAALMRKKKTDE